MKVYIHSIDLVRWNLAKSDQITLYKKRPKCTEEFCKILAFDLAVKPMQNRKGEVTSKDKTKKRRYLRDS
jgi:hypothetical protein